ncbi:heavy-metal-associated domain-containing protein [Bizionia gelidisalsuginis]|uniref:Heavy-metal-associated domain-containing protein n=2 Tax=Bizionia TaxID=283785 RepID=A0A8H2QII5_9FLAO|nr:MULTISPECIES: heavy metal-associated domain-containing protein [Bizionia]TYB70707.1 heavy-metal-associated domain-containing protein [Bizionia saleffrena]TYC10165.1 heavy-metal-associated domain-containing protein [Bizionia gelidisalsuginis]
MKNLKNSIVIAVLALLAFNCKNEAQPEVKTVDTETTVTADAEKAELDPNATYAKAEFKIEGMTCAIGCAKTIEKKISKMEGVKSVAVDFDRELAMVEYDEAKVTPASLETTVTGVSDTYTVKDIKSVTAFSKAKSCDKDCCKDKTAEEKANCKMDCCTKAAEGLEKTMACAKDCKKACCSKEAKKA